MSYLSKNIQFIGKRYFQKKSSDKINFVKFSKELKNIDNVTLQRWSQGSVKSPQTSTLNAMAQGLNEIIKEKESIIINLTANDLQNTDLEQTYFKTILENKEAALAFTQNDISKYSQPGPQGEDIPLGRPPTNYELSIIRQICQIMNGSEFIPLSREVDRIVECLSLISHDLTLIDSLNKFIRSFRGGDLGNRNDGSHARGKGTT